MEIDCCLMIPRFATSRRKPNATTMVAIAILITIFMQVLFLESDQDMVVPTLDDHNNKMMMIDESSSSSSLVVWERQKEWLCRNRVPNLEAAAQTFHTAQKVFFLQNENTELLSREATDRFFSHWPGHITYHKRDTNHRATALRTYKCGSFTINYYFQNMLSTLGGEVTTSLHWKDFPHHDEKLGCIVSSFRDPVSHFLSGLGEVEARTNREIQNGKGKPDATYEQLKEATPERFLAFVRFLLDGEWLSVKKFRNNIKFLGHVYTQSGHLLHLHSVNKTVTKFINMKDIDAKFADVLKDSCIMPDTIPPLTKTKSHAKVKGLDSVLKNLWNDANGGVASGEVQRAFQSICLLNAVDYACLAPELKELPPSICWDTFQQYLPKF